MVILNLVTAINLLVFFCLLFFRKNNALPNKILALILVDPAINFISNINVLSGDLHNYTFAFFIAQVTGCLFAPLVYIYILLMTGKKIKLGNPAYLGTLAITLFIGFCAVRYYLLPTPLKVDYVNGIINEPYPEDMAIVNIAFAILQQIYFTMGAVQVYRYRKSLSNVFSSYEQTRVKFITVFISLIWLLNLLSIGFYATLKTSTVEYVVLPLVLTVIYSFILYFSFHYNSIFTTQTYQTFQEASHLPDIVAKAAVTQSDDADTSSLQELLDTIEASMATNEWFTDPELTITALAVKLKIPVKKLSLCFNKLLNKNFYDYVNGKRVQKSTALLSTQKNYTIEAIARESGFNSRSVFYRAFKKQTGKTPLQYMDSN
jgi:AraC-like DNA-binding protein